MYHSHKCSNDQLSHPAIWYLWESIHIIALLECGSKNLMQVPLFINYACFSAEYAGDSYYDPAFNFLFIF